MLNDICRFYAGRQTMSYTVSLFHLDNAKPLFAQILSVWLCSMSPGAKLACLQSRPDEQLKPFIGKE